MRASTKIILAMFILSFLALGVSAIGYIYFGLSAEISNILTYASLLLFELALLWGIISIVGFKRLCKWIYFAIVTSISLSFVLVGAAYGIVVYIIMLIISIALLASLVPMVFKNRG